MRAYRIGCSSKLLLSLFRNGAYPAYKITNAAPHDGKMIDVRVSHSNDLVEFLFLTDEPGEIPEACSLWDHSTEILPVIHVGDFR